MQLALLATLWCFMIPKAFAESLLVPNARSEVLPGRWMVLVEGRHERLSVRGVDISSTSIFFGPAVGLTNTVTLRASLEAGRFTTANGQIHEVGVGNPEVSVKWNFVSFLKPGRYHRLAVEPKVVLAGGHPTTFFFWEPAVRDQVQFTAPGWSPGADLIYSYGNGKMVTNLIAGYSRPGTHEGFRLGQEWRGTADVEPVLKRFEGGEISLIFGGTYQQNGSIHEEVRGAIPGTAAKRMWGIGGIQFAAGERVAVEVQYRHAFNQTLGPLIPKWGNEIRVGLRLVQ